MSGGWADAGAAGWKFANGWEWTSAMRYGTGFEEADAFNQWAPSSVVKVPVGDRWNVHAEFLFQRRRRLPVLKRLAKGAAT